MINYEETRPDPLPSAHYNKLEWLRNDIDDLVVLDEEGRLTSDPLDYFRSILSDIIDTICETDDQRIRTSYTNHNIEDVAESLRTENPVSVSKSLDMMQMRYHPNTRSNMIRHVPVLQ